MRAVVNINIDGTHRGFQVRLEAEDDGEKAILHLLTQHQTFSLRRISYYHESYKLTDTIQLEPTPKEGASS